eukprot:2822256-Pyramimonas_sp.AAC.1
MWPTPATDRPAARRSTPGWRRQPAQGRSNAPAVGVAQVHVTEGMQHYARRSSMHETRCKQ